MATRYEARRPITHKGHKYRPGDEITGFTGWWRYWQYLRYASVIELLDVGAPTSLVATRGDEQASITWTNPADGGSPITNFEYELDGSTTWVPFNPAIIDPPGVITGLTNGVEVSVKIRAVTVEDPQGAASGAVLVTPATTPALPTSLVATPTDTDVSIAFTPGDDGGDAITNYQYKVGAGAWTAFAPADTTSPVVIAGLTKGTEYSVLLRAINTVGNGASSAALVFTTDSEPAAPTSLVATPGNTQASIAFTPGAANGSAITDYEYKVDAGAWTSGATAVSPVVVTGLVNDVEVSIVLRAINAVGNGAESAAVLVTPTA